MPAAVYSPFEARARERSDPVFALHVGDTWRPPFEGARAEDLKVDEIAGLHNYTDTQGLPPLVDALCEKLRARNGLACERDQLLVGAGATGVLACAVGSVVDPGDEVLILAPFWPLIRGIVQAFRGVPVEVPFYDRIFDLEEALAALEERTSERTVALYVSTPSNPTGRVLPGDWLEAFAEFARRHDLWLLSDEVYEDYVYRGEHVSLAPLAPERTVAVHSFSKAYGMAGNRVGYLAAPREWAAQARKIATHTFYGAPTPGQWAALRALEGGAGWIAESREAYREVGAQAAALLGQEAPAGSTFLFLDVSAQLGARGLEGFLADCFEDGVLVAPGASSGQDYGDWVRLCYTALPPEKALEAVRRLARRCGRDVPPVAAES